MNGKNSILTQPPQPDTLSSENPSALQSRAHQGRSLHRSASPQNRVAAIKFKFPNVISSQNRWPKR